MAQNETISFTIPENMRYVTLEAYDSAGLVYRQEFDVLPDGFKSVGALYRRGGGGDEGGNARGGAGESGSPNPKGFNPAGTILPSYGGGAGDPQKPGAGRPGSGKIFIHYK